MKWVHFFFIVTLAVCGASVSPQALAQTRAEESAPVSRGECREHLARELTFAPERAARLSTQTPVTFELMDRVGRLAYGRGPWSAVECESQLQAVVHALYRYLGRRFRQTLEEGNLELFFHEYRVAQPFHSSGRAVERFQSVVTPGMAQNYLQKIEQRLVHNLIPSRWSRFASQSISLTEWSAEWEGVLGSRSAAAVDLTHQRVALDPFAMPPEELQIFLFHEMAHLDDSARHSITDFRSQLENETYAWQETLDYLHWRETQGLVTPLGLSGLQSSLERMGARAFAWAALRTRGLVLE